MWWVDVAIASHHKVSTIHSCMWCFTSFCLFPWMVLRLVSLRFRNHCWHFRLKVDFRSCLSLFRKFISLRTRRVANKYRNLNFPAKKRSRNSQIQETKEILCLIVIHQSGSPPLSWFYGWFWYLQVVTLIPLLKKYIFISFVYLVFSEVFTVLFHWFPPFFLHNFSAVFNVCFLPKIAYKNLLKKSKGICETKVHRKAKEASET